MRSDALVKVVLPVEGARALPLTFTCSERRYERESIQTSRERERERPHRKSCLYMIDRKVKEEWAGEQRNVIVRKHWRKIDQRSKMRKISEVSVPAQFR